MIPSMPRAHKAALLSGAGDGPGSGVSWAPVKGILMGQGRRASLACRTLPVSQVETLPGRLPCGGWRKAASPLDYLAKSWPISLNALNSSALPQGSKRNIVACSPT